MPRHLHLDFETFSQADLKDVGAYRYAFDPSTEILCAAMALGYGEPVIWDSSKPLTVNDELEPYWDALEDPSVLIYAHNAQFEIALSQALMFKTWGIQCPEISRWRCTKSLAHRAALPGGLEKLAAALELPNVKDKRGSALIKRFCIMQTAKKPTKKNPDGIAPCRIFPKDDPVAFAELLNYCKQDVRTEQDVAWQLSCFDEPINNANYTLHETINSRGVAVNVDALRHTQLLISEETNAVATRFRNLTGFEVTQGAVLLNWLHGKGVHLDNLQAETIETFLEGVDEDQLSTGEKQPVQALRMKQSIAYASIKKIATMLECVGPHDNRIRGMLNHHGATTGRSTNSLVQFQNMKRPTIKDADGNGTSEEAYRDICNGISREMLELSYGSPLEVISSCVRHFIHNVCLFCGGAGNPQFGLPCPECGGNTESNFLDADYSAIEARIVCWLAGQEDALDEYRQGIDRYKVMATLIYGIPIEQVNKHPQRFVGKNAILGCGFGMGATKFRKDCLKKGGYVLPLGLEEIAVNAFRAKHKKVKQLWWDTKKAAINAVVRKGQTFKAGPFLSFTFQEVEGFPFLFMTLPSGRKLSYPKPEVINGDLYVHRKTIGVNWEQQETGGCTLTENATQAVAADIMCHGAHNAEKAGYPIMMLVHDQALSYSLPGQTAEEFVRLLTDMPPWAKGLPIEAEGALVPFYKKD